VQLVELKNGEAYNGRMEACDTWMNMHLHEVICTAKDGEKFWRMKEVYIRGNTIKYIRVPEDTLGKAVEEKQSKRTGALLPPRPAVPFIKSPLMCPFAFTVNVSVL
jgi:small nuclear ribonucleoprotein (snRNP)-like protein